MMDTDFERLSEVEPASKPVGIVAFALHLISRYFDWWNERVARAEQRRRERAEREAREAVAWLFAGISAFVAGAQAFKDELKKDGYG